MSLIYNGTAITKLIYNGTEIQTAKYNGTTVYQGIDPTKSSFTEEEFIAVVNATLQSKMTIGASVTLTNTYSEYYGSTNHVYNVIGVNHQDIPDDTSSIATDSVDLYIKDKCVYGAVWGTYVYNTCNIRTWINDTYYNAFTNVKVLMKTMNVLYASNSTVNDKVKPLSCAEVGVTGESHVGKFGVKYEAFASHSGTSGYSDISRTLPSESTYYGFRDRAINGGWGTMTMYPNGNIIWTNGANFGVAPVIRF